MNITIKSLCTSPLYAALWPALAKFRDFEQLPHLSELNTELSIDGITFVAQESKSNHFSDGYEPRIYLHGEVQTRERSWHDFFNALVWQQFPQSKKLINQLQYSLQKQRYPEKQRLPAENMLTLFDENGAIVIAQNPELLELIKQHRWHELFWQRRDEVRQQLQVYIFGHGLYEKAINPYLGLTAQALLFVDTMPCCIDSLVAKYIGDHSTQLKTDHVNPLPILGIPGWWAQNNNEDFYTNKAYFRDKPFTSSCKVNRESVC